MKDSVANPTSEDTWVQILIGEARRDLVFLWHIAGGRLGGPRVAVDLATLKRVVEALLRNGCAVGFGNPETAEWRTPEELQVPRELLPDTIARLWNDRPTEYEFLVFTLPSNPDPASHKGGT